DLRRAPALLQPGRPRHARSGADEPRRHRPARFGADVYVCMGYGPIAAFLVALFPTKIRYTSMSLPYHLGNGWFGGFLPLIATAVTAPAGGENTLGRGGISPGWVYS